MTTPDFIRARRPHQKQERRSQLLQTALRMLEEHEDIHQLSLNELARRTGMAKSNVYRYFETREALLLALLWLEWSAWFEDLKQGYHPKGRAQTGWEALVDQIARTLARRPLLGRLMASLAGVLEQNLSEETVVAFKRDSLVFFGEVAFFLEEKAPGLNPDRVSEFLHDACVIVAGLHPFAHPSPVVEEALKRPELRFFRRDYEADLVRMLRALAAGVFSGA